MNLEQAVAGLPVLVLRLEIMPQKTLKLPAENKGNTVRGAFGTAFRRLVCIPQCKSASSCPLDHQCPYKAVFEPNPPAESERLSGNHDIPRPFVFRPQITAKATYLPGEVFEFGLILLGRAVDYLPYFVLAFREVTRQGFGLNRAPCQLQGVWAATSPPDTLAGGHETCVYSAGDELFRAPEPLVLSDWIQERLRQLGHADGPEGKRQTTFVQTRTITVRYLTPTNLKSDGHTIRQPAFHHLFKRLRDRLNALCTFYGSGPIEVDFKGIGERSEQVGTRMAHIKWLERSRRSSKTRQRHELSGFEGECTYEGELAEFLPWLAAGEVIGVGRHTAWGNGLYAVS